MMCPKTLLTNGEIIKEAFHNRIVLVEYKSTCDLVTCIDKLVESSIKQELLQEFPCYGFIGEETSAKSVKSRFVWVLDPTDGTTNFVHGIPMVCISLALLDKGRTILGIVYNPILNELFHAQLGQGVYYNNQLIVATKPFPQTLDQVLTACEYGSDLNPTVLSAKLASYLQICLKGVRGIRSMVSAAIQLCYVARGILDAYSEAGVVHIWDVAAGILIVQEAGGLVVNFDHSTDELDLCCRKFLAVKGVPENSPQGLQRAIEMIPQI